MLEVQLSEKCTNRILFVILWGMRNKGTKDTLHTYISIDLKYIVGHFEGFQNKRISIISIDQLTSRPINYLSELPKAKNR